MSARESVSAPRSVTVRTAAFDDPASAPLLEGLRHEYSSRYGKVAPTELARHPERFTTARRGALVLLLDGDATVAGGALREYDPELAAADALPVGFPAEPTAEFKRIWTHSAYRRRGLARRVLEELEDRARGFGYQQVFLATGPSQPEAVGLYLAAGYTHLPDLGAATRGSVIHPFIKSLI